MADMKKSRMGEIVLLTGEINEELAEWRKREIHPQGVPIVGMYLDLQFHALLDLLVKHDVVDRDEWEYEWKKSCLAELLRQRKEIEHNMAQADIVQGIVGPDGAPIKVQPNGD